MSARGWTVPTILLAASLSLGAAPPAAPPAAAKSTPPAPQPAKQIHFPAFEQRTLSNGLRVVVIEQHESPAVSLRLLLPAGKVFAPAAKAGLAGATAALIHEGTATRSAQQIAQAIDFVGGSLDTFASKESAYVSARVTSDQIDLGLDLLADVILHPTFPQEELDRWRNQALSSLQIQLSDPSYLADAAFERLVLGDHPYGLPDDGTPESIGGLTRDDLVAFHRSRYVPNDSILAVVGDVKPGDAFARVERAFGGWKKGAKADLPPAAAREGQRRVVVIDKPDAVQTEIRVGQPGIAYTSPDLFTARVYDAVVGGSSTSRLFAEVRRKRGLAYGASSEFLLPTRPGWFETSTSTKTQSSVQALQVMLDVLGDMGKQPVPADELSARKTYITGAFPLEIETPDGIASKVLEAMKFGYGREFLESYRDKVDAVTAAQVEDFARREIHPERMLIVLVGNASAFADELGKAFGPFERIPAGEVDLIHPDLRKPRPADRPKP
jgi:zinc protease